MSTTDFLKSIGKTQTTDVHVQNTKKVWNYQRDKVRPLFLEAAAAIDLLVETLTPEQWKAISTLLNQNEPLENGSDLEKRGKRLTLAMLVNHGDLYEHRDDIALYGMKAESERSQALAKKFEENYGGKNE